MTFAKGKHPGAVWKKTDFQIHTPRDPNWEGSPHIPGGNGGDQQRRKWAEGFVEKCISLNLTAIAITDHHDFCFIPYVRQYLAEKHLEDRLWLFPGVEVTCNDAVQCLVLFDVDSDDAAWDRLYGGHLTAIPRPSSSTAEAPQAQQCGKDLGRFINDLLEDTTLSSCCIVLPHAGSESAYKSVLRQGFNVRFRDLRADGVYSDQNLSSIGDAAKNKIYGRTPNWGTRRRGIITTGDNRSADFRTLGRNACWIRLGERTAESIRQASLADSARINYQEPALPAQRILAMTVKSSLCELDIVFNDGFTALIGGRGSGKSALLEYLRFGLGRSATDTRDDIPERHRSLVADTLRGGFVSVVMERDGVVETWRRQGGQADSIEVVVENSPAELVSIDAAQRRFHARAFYQKQLSTLVLDPRTAAEQITGIAAAEFLEQRRTLEQDILSTKREVRTALQKTIELWAAEGEHRQAQSAVEDLKRRIEAIKKKLEEAGLSPESQAILSQSPRHNRARALLDEAKSSIAEDIATISSLIGSIPSIESEGWQTVADFAELSKFVEQAALTREVIRTHLRGALEALQTLAKQRADADTQFTTRYEVFTKRYNEAAAQQAHLKALLSDANKLAGDLQAAETTERRSDSRVRQLQGAETELYAARQDLEGKLEEKRAVLRQAANRVSEMSADVLRAQVRREEVPDAWLGTLIALCENQRIQELSAKCEERVRTLSASADPLKEWNQLADRMVEILRHRVQNATGIVDPNGKTGLKLRTALFPNMTERQVSGIYNKLAENQVGEILTALPDDFIAFEYSDKKAHIPFEQASPGQQAAALLNLLLRQEAGTLIIDQPEDDLDNRVIMEIVSLLQTTKRKRQIIFTTHNPNFVVNGDADKVVVLRPATPAVGISGATNSPSRIEIEVDGAIETESVRHSITETMEGGHAAFDLRSRKYLFKS